mmetsp:Transcript_11080/g.27980  ORF Transcript_11080/g.27980 Transcript_11080/m.27980 type:complete len:250 (-) Transcript_11080:134-883(-)
MDRRPGGSGDDAHAARLQPAEDERPLRRPARANRRLLVEGLAPAQAAPARPLGQLEDVHHAGRVECEQRARRGGRPVRRVQPRARKQREPVLGHLHGPRARRVERVDRVEVQHGRALLARSECAEQLLRAVERQHEQRRAAAEGQLAERGLHGLARHPEILEPARRRPLEAKRRRREEPAINVGHAERVGRLGQPERVATLDQRRSPGLRLVVRTCRAADEAHKLHLFSVRRHGGRELARLWLAPVVRR